MHTGRRDLFVLLLCAIPVLGGVLIFYDYQSTGSVPFSLPDLTAPTLPFLDTLLPPGWEGHFSSIQNNLGLIAAAGAMACLVCIFLSGVWVDHVLVRRHAGVEEEADLVDDDAAAPWLTGEGVAR